MIDAREAVAICAEEFPRGLEALIERFSISVELAKLNVDGWCFRDSDGIRVVRLNLNSPETRRRFTLAHEIAHFVLEPMTTRFTAIKNLYEYNSKSEFEKQVDELASQLLLPYKILGPIVERSQIDHDFLKSMARRAKISEVVVALRLIKLEKHLGLRSSTVFHLASGRCKWKFPLDSIFPDSIGIELSREAKDGRVRTVYKPYGDRKLVGCVSPNESYHIVFVHSVPLDAPEPSSQSRSIQDLKQRLFTAERKSFQSQLAGKLGQWAKKYPELELRVSFELFVDHYDKPTYWYTPEDHDVFTSNDSLDFCYAELERLAERFRPL